MKKTNALVGTFLNIEHYIRNCNTIIGCKYLTGLNFFISVMCSCSTPSHGTGYHYNKFTCSDGLTSYCSTEEECYSSQPFAYGELYDGCRVPPGES